MKSSRGQLAVFLLFVVIFLGLRLANYEPPNWSVSNFDTQEYIRVAHLPIFTSRFFTSNRTATIALMYKLAEPEGGYEVTNLSSPGDFLSPALTEQPGLGSVTKVQALVSVAAWILVAFVVFRNLTRPWSKIMGALLVLFFALSPQVAEWDYVLMSEPISLSLFIGLLALSIEVVLRIANSDGKFNRGDRVLLASWFVLAVLWVFARDTNAYMLAVIIGFVLLALIVGRKLRIRMPERDLLAVTALLAVLFLVNVRSAQASGRWINPFFNNLLEHVLSDPEHLAFFKARGFPATDEVLALKDSPYTQLKFFEIDYLLDWTQTRGTSTYIQFIIAHPGWAWQTLVDGTKASFAENNQPFFTRNEDVTPAWLVYLGDLLHPKDISVLAVVLLEFALLGYLTLRGSDHRLAGVTACLVLFFVGEFVMLSVSILGDASSVVRHTVGSLIPIRLSVWLLPPFILDTLASRKR